MPASANQVTGRQVLIFVTLFTWSATSVATAGLMLKDVAPDLEAVSRQRSLRSENTEGTGSNHAHEERAPPLVNAVSEGIGLDRVMNQFSLEHLETMGFTRPFDLNEKTFFESQHFLEWVDSVYQRFGDSSEEKKRALTAMLVMLADDLKGNLAVDIFAATKIDKAKDIATKLLNMLYDVWVDERLPKEVFKFFKIDQTEGSPFRNPMLRGWATFVSSRYPTHSEKEMLKFLNELYPKKDRLVRILVAGLTMKDTGSIADRLLDRMIAEWREKWNLSAKRVYQRLRIDRIPDGFAKRLLIAKWRAVVKSELDLTVKMFYSSKKRRGRSK